MKMLFGRSVTVGILYSFASAVAVFNVFFAIRPWTASPPPIKVVPRDIVQHPDWAQANYIAQGPYLESRFGKVSIHSQEGQLVPGPDFFLRTSSLDLMIDAKPSLEYGFGGAQIESLDSEKLFASGSDTQCVGANSGYGSDQRCEIQVYVSLIPLPEDEPLQLMETDLSPNKIALVDSRLLDDDKK